VRLLRSHMVRCQTSQCGTRNGSCYDVTWSDLHHPTIMRRWLLIHVTLL
jgi:hypothetical protein